MRRLRTTLAAGSCPTPRAAAPQLQNSFEMVSSDSLSPFAETGTAQPGYRPRECKYKKKEGLGWVTLSTDQSHVRSVTYARFRSGGCLQTIHGIAHRLPNQFHL